MFTFLRRSVGNRVSTNVEIRKSVNSQFLNT